MADTHPSVRLLNPEVLDTCAEDEAARVLPDCPRTPGVNPKTTVWKYLKTYPEFEINKQIDRKLLFRNVHISADSSFYKALLGLAESIGASSGGNIIHCMLVSVAPNRYLRGFR